MTTKQKCQHIAKAAILRHPNSEPLLWESVYKYLPADHKEMIEFWYREAIEKIGKPKV